jgi:ribonuclease P protein subunit RPR2
MAKKKDKEDTKTASPTPNGIPNRDIIQRLNFLNQASVYLQQISSTPEHDSTSTLERGGVQDLSRFYVRCMKTIGTKAVVKMSVSFVIVLNIDPILSRSPFIGIPQ